MLIKIVGLRSLPGETKTDYMIRACRKIRHLKGFHGVADWDAIYFRTIFAWAGHVARMRQYAATRLTYKVLQFKSWLWISAVANDNEGGQLHGRKLRTWRWERTLYKYFTDRDWQDVAQDKAFWISQLDVLVQWRRNL